MIKNLAKIITHLLSAVPSSSARSFPVCPGKVEKLYEHRTIQNVNNYYNLGTGDSRDLKWQNARPVFLKSAKLEVKNCENALSIVYPTTEPGIRKKSDQKQHVIPPISYLFFSAKKRQEADHYQ